MSEQDDYELKPDEKKEPAEGATRPKPGEPGWVEPVPVIEMAESSVSEEEPKDPDVEHNKALAILGYILFIIPLVSAPKSPFARFHANQGLLVFILWCLAVIGCVVLYIASWIAEGVFVKIWLLATFFSCIFHAIMPLLLLGVLALTIVGIIHAANGEKKALPLVGHWTLIK